MISGKERFGEWSVIDRASYFQKTVKVYSKTFIMNFDSEKSDVSEYSYDHLAFVSEGVGHIQ